MVSKHVTKIILDSGIGLDLELMSAWARGANLS